MSTFIQILNILNDNLLSIGLIIFSPAIYQLVRTITLFLVWKFAVNQNNIIVIEYYPNREFKRVTLSKPDKTKKPEPDKQ
ncbi:hypothetical protein BGI05_01315 [Snodgrassella alvi]|uniref:hypothetical protein n=1 Tax=Snodgrassella TaxID=1193515 RepID=UPI000A040A3E|nr:MULTISPECIES: hypothetical protein [Snodgrassella]NUF08013.1 hypothetical protein [Snodgrassella sp. ESL0324]ORF04734.1 hypothetical protein BGH97_00345 [Snodgrassella alvi]ORF09610.1 hypothetical protein BGH99_01790 [Snodgrassella alvi]ORF14289.1 hypothetical protein BGI02_05355 [Snodgrassella alvi]ORF15603.1 hypothetical protein BGI00_00510 [Snodgrassella alvi]